MADTEEIEEIQSEYKDEHKRKNRKRKKNFLVNARKYGKKGRFGRGTELSADTYQYFVNALELLKNGFETENEKEIFVNNVLEQTTNEEVNYSCNQIGCRVIESLLSFANSDTLERYIKAFSEDLRPILADRFASHVIQALLKKSAHIGAKYNPENPDSHIENCYNYALKISKFLLNNLEDFVWDQYGNHIIRTAITSLAGIIETNEDVNKKDKQKEEMVLQKIKKEELPDAYIEVVLEYADRLSKWPQFSDMPHDINTSALLQTLLPALKNVSSKAHKKFLKKLIDSCFAKDETNEEDNKNLDIENNSQNLPPAFKSNACMRLLEVALEYSTSKYFTQIYAKCFINKLAVLAQMKDCNFSVQKLIKHCNEKEEFEPIYDEMANEFENILIKGYSGVISNLALTCERLISRQGNFVQNLMSALHCAEPADKQIQFVPLTLRLIPLDRYEAVRESDKNYFVHLHGSVIVQTMLKFNKPIKIVTSLLEMSTQDLVSLFCDPKGSHVADAFTQSKFIGEKSREKLVRKMKGSFQELVVSKHGSRSFDAIWKTAGSKHKYQIMEELAVKDGLWSTNKFGKLIAIKLNLTVFKRSKEAWKSTLGSEDKKKELFADILNETA